MRKICLDIYKVQDEQFICSKWYSCPPPNSSLPLLNSTPFLIRPSITHPPTPSLIRFSLIGPATPIHFPEYVNVCMYIITTYEKANTGNEEW